MEKNMEEMSYAEIWDSAKNELIFLEPAVRDIIKDSFVFLFLLV